MVRGHGASRDCTNNMCNGRWGTRATNKKICLEGEEVVQNLLLARIYVLKPHTWSNQKSDIATVQLLGYGMIAGYFALDLHTLLI
jgi:hypothetical protein